MGDNDIIIKDLVHVARMGAEGKVDDVEMYLKRIVRRTNSPYDRETIGKLKKVITTQNNFTNNALRKTNNAIVPVDFDTRLKLARYEHPVKLDHEPIFTESIESNIDQIIQERLNRKLLLKSGLSPSKSILFTGPPGVGKTLSAKYIASKLNTPLVTLDLSNVMSSFLGKTGNNIKNVLDYAKENQCILFLDEFDAIAKRRDDESEVGELKRLVTVLLQEIDSWTDDSLLIAATNHMDLLDPAIWRRFDMQINFPLPNKKDLNEAIQSFFGRDWPNIKKDKDILHIGLMNMSFSDIERLINQIRRKAIIEGRDIKEVLYDVLEPEIKKKSTQTRKTAASVLKGKGRTERAIRNATGLSRDTIRKIDK